MDGTHYNHLYNLHTRLHEARQTCLNETSHDLMGYWQEHIDDLVIAINRYVAKNGLNKKDADRIGKLIQEIKK